MNDLQTQLFNTLYSKYGTMLLSKKQTAEVLGVSEVTLNREKANGTGIEYQQTGLGAVRYPLHALVEAITNNGIKTA